MYTSLVPFQYHYGTTTAVLCRPVLEYNMIGQVNRSTEVVFQEDVDVMVMSVTVRLECYIISLSHFGNI